MKTLMVKIDLYGFFYVCEFHGNLLLNVILFSPFIGIAEMWQGFPNQNNILLDYYIIHTCIDFTT
jgi:hypothetical protein